MEPTDFDRFTMPAIDRERRAKGRELETEWSNYEWDNVRRQWQSFRINARGQY